MHLIVERFPEVLNTQVEMETLLHMRLTHEVKVWSRWKSIKIQRINPQDDDYRRISSYLVIQPNFELIALDPFNSDFSTRKQWEETNLWLQIPEGDVQQLHEAILLLNKGRCLNISAFCRAAIADKLERFEKLDAREVIQWRQSLLPAWCRGGNAGGAAESQSGM